MATASMNERALHGSAASNAQAVPAPSPAPSRAPPYKEPRQQRPLSLGAGNDWVPFPLLLVGDGNCSPPPPPAPLAASAGEMEALLKVKS